MTGDDAILDASAGLTLGRTKFVPQASEMLKLQNDSILDYLILIKLNTAGCDG
jgi:hypothetical protein